MKFEDITSGIEQGISYCWPPLLAIGLAAWIVKKLLPGVFETKPKVEESEPSETDREQGLIQRVAALVKELQQSLEPLGLSKLVPIAGVVVILTFFSAVSRFLYGPIDAMPPSYSMRPQVLLNETLSDMDRQLLIRTYPSAYNVTDAISMAMGEAEEDEGYARHYEAFWSMGILFSKWSVFVCSCCLVIGVTRKHHRRRLLLKCLPMLAVCSLVWGVCFLGNLYESEQRIHSEWRIARNALQRNATDKMRSDPLTKKERWKMFEVYDKDFNWWNLTWSNISLPFSWIKRTLLPRQIPELSTDEAEVSSQVFRLRVGSKPPSWMIEEMNAREASALNPPPSK